MSGGSYDDTCPNCSGELQIYSDTKPFDFTTGLCLDCGFFYDIKTGQLSFRELNKHRIEIMDMDPLKKRRRANIDPDLEW